MLEQESLISKKRKEKIGIIIQKSELEAKELDSLTLQENLFAIRYYQYCNEHYHVDEYETKKQILKNSLVKKIKKRPELFSLKDKMSQLPFINVSCLDLFSQEKLAKDAVQHYKQQRRELEINRIEIQEKGNELLEFYLYYGIERARIDMGAYSTELEFKTLLDIVPKEMITVNPKLRFAMIDFIEEIETPQNYQGKEQVLLRKEEAMKSEIKQARILMPIQLHGEISEQGEEAQDFQIAALKSKNGNSYIPVFTDWYSFQMCYDSNVWKGMLVDLKEIKGFLQGGGIVINPKNENISVSAEEILEIMK